MEIEDLKAIWQKYDSKLDNLEKMNKKLVMETLSRKPQKKLNWMKYRSLYSLIMVPVVLILTLHGYFKIGNTDFKFIIGFLLTLSVCIYSCYIEFKSYMTIKGVDLNNDSIIESAKKVSVFKSLFVNRQKYTLMTYPILFAGILLIGWKTFTFNSNTIMFMLFLSVFSLYWGIKQHKRYKGKIELLEKEISELNEYLK